MIADRVGEHPCVFLGGLLGGAHDCRTDRCASPTGKLPWSGIRARHCHGWSSVSRACSCGKSGGRDPARTDSKALVMTGGPGVGKDDDRQCHPADTRSEGRCDFLLCAPTRPRGQAHEGGNRL